ncbi:DUF4288 domain-containing protein [Undibacterium sp. Di24W]|uniref:DUF4288 domain-containing protein n=1 Tax=Undibacterium sp. Di24W TaxID=3413033 RepID=UPI003BEFFDF5
MDWYGIRNIYLFKVKADGTNVFEERIVCIQAETEQEAHQKGLRESEEYSDANGFESGSQQDAYRQDGDPLIDGYEVYSQLFESPESLEEFYENRYNRYKYYPDETNHN